RECAAQAARLPDGQLSFRPDERALSERSGRAFRIRYPANVDIWRAATRNIRAERSQRPEKAMLNSAPRASAVRPTAPAAAWTTAARIIARIIPVASKRTRIEPSRATPITPAKTRL